MKHKLLLIAVVLFGMALTAQAQLLGLSIGRHGFSFGIGLPFCSWGPSIVYDSPLVYAEPAPFMYSPPPAAYYPGPAAYAAPPAPVRQPPVWEPSGPLPGRWVPEPNPYRYTPSASTAPAQTVTITKGTGGMLIYSSR